MDDLMLRAYISNIQHFNVHDGSGFRTTVFFQGCKLRCRWCQNPETQSLKPLILYDKNQCIQCEMCVEVCENNLIESKGIEKIIDRSHCNLCMRCEEKCYSGAIKFSSHLMTVDEVVKECIIEKEVYKYHSGGVTLSGGEPLLNEIYASGIC